MLGLYLVINCDRHKKYFWKENRLSQLSPDEGHLHSNMRTMKRKRRRTRRTGVHTWSICHAYTFGLTEINHLLCATRPDVCSSVSIRTLIPILHQKAKRGTPHQAKQAVHCIHAIFNNKEVQLAQIFEVGDRFLTELFQDFKKSDLIYHTF